MSIENHIGYKRLRDCSHLDFLDKRKKSSHNITDYYLTLPWVDSTRDSSEIVFWIMFVSQSSKSFIHFSIKRTNYLIYGQAKWRELLAKNFPKTLR